jgi:hypothetical protein
MLHRIAIIVAALAVGSACIATDALARGGGSGSRGGFGGMGERQFGDAMRGGHFGGRAQRQHYGLSRGWAAPYGYYGDSGYYDPTVAPDEQPTYPTTALPPREGRPRSTGCSTQTYKVPSERGGEASVNVVRC